MAQVEVRPAGDVQRVQNVLARRFPGAEMYVDRFFDAVRINGQIIWQGFDDVKQIDRQRAISRALDEELGPESDNVSVILAYTPTEWQAMGED